MANPVSYQILEAIKTRLDAISTVGGFNSDPEIVLGVQEVNPDQIDAGPVITVYELGDEPEGDGQICGNMLINMQVVVSGFVKFGDDDTSLKMALLWQDIMRSVFLTDVTLGGLAVSIWRGGRQFNYPQPGGETVAVQQTVNVNYLETYGNP